MRNVTFKILRIIILKVLVRQESTRKVGFTITQQEEVIRGQLENLQVVN